MPAKPGDSGGVEAGIEHLGGGAAGGVATEISKAAVCVGESLRVGYVVLPHCIMDVKPHVVAAIAIEVDCCDDVRVGDAVDGDVSDSTVDDRGLGTLSKSQR
jgi:hypothetical protein